MEKYFKICKGHPLYKAFWKYQKSGIAINIIIKDFLPKWGIETSEYCPFNESLMIVPTKNDVDKYSGVLCKGVENGLRRFKKNSTVSKDWVKTLADTGTKVLCYPWMFAYFGLCGKSSSTMFICNETLCLQHTCEHETATPDGMMEIKGSEFHLALEKANAGAGAQDE